MKYSSRIRVGNRLYFRALRAHELCGHALTECLLIASFAALVLAGMPAIANYGTKRMQTVAAARLVAWQRTVWMPASGEPGIDSDEVRLGASGSIKKSNDDITNDIRRHIFLDQTKNGASIHAANIAEFTGGVPDIPASTSSVKVSSTKVKLPAMQNGLNVLWEGVGKAQDQLSKNPFTKSMSTFNFVYNGYMRHQVDVTETNPLYKDVPVVTMSEQVTMLTEAWNAGGLNREKAKISGLVPLAVLNSPYFKFLTDGLNSSGDAINYVFPSVKLSETSIGLKPGGANEASVPLDRYELNSGADSLAEDSTADITRSTFRYYRSYPPPPVASSLP